MTEIEQTTVTRPDPFAMFDDWAAVLRVYVLVTALSLGLALILELMIGVSPGKVLLVVLPASVSLLVAIPVVRAHIANNRDVRGRAEQYPALNVLTPALFEQEAGEAVEVTIWPSLPPPTILRDYELALPGAADRIVTLLEQQASHRQALESRRAEAEIAQAARGQLFGFVLLLAAVTASCILLWKGKSIPGTIAFITTFASLVGVFIAGKIEQARANQKKIKKLSKTLESFHHNTANERS
ncbi:MAG TPA: DUF2335 domain-containing protein [Pyrinomonadaceae bacterium]|nr:DUF2335 domain-containing protein [Pyrinomonadaceae bacterium]